MPDLANFIETLYTYAGLTLEEAPTIEESDEYLTITITLAEDDSGVGIGNRGEALQAVQRVVRVIYGSEYPEKRIILDVNEYRKNRESKLIEMAREVAQDVIDTGEPHEVHAYLNSQERFVIHNFLSTDPEYADVVRSESEGVGRNRRLVVYRKDE